MFLSFEHVDFCHCFGFRPSFIKSGVFRPVMAGLTENQGLWSNTYLVPERKLSFPPISAPISNFNPRNTTSITVVKIFVFLDLIAKS